MTEIEKVIDRKSRKYNDTASWEQQYPVDVEIQALEWVRMIIRSWKERDNWSQLV